MPFVQVSLLKGRSKATVKAVGDAIHRALVEEFGIPELDKFQVIRELEADQLVFPPSYLEIPHSENMVYIQITAKEGRTTEMKVRLYKKIASLIHQHTGISTDDVFIVLTENRAENWSFGRGEAQLVTEA